MTTGTSAKQTELSYHKEKGYRLQIGAYFTPEGKRLGKVWWFGKVDPYWAEDQARFVRLIFDKACPDGVWTEHATEWAKKVIRRLRENYESRLKSAAWTLERAGLIVTVNPGPRAGSAVARTVAPKTEGESVNTSALHAVLDSYVVAMQAKPLSVPYKRRVAETIADLKRFRPDVPLAEIDRVWLERLTDEIKSRPPSRRKGKGKKQPLSPHTVKTYLQHWRQAFDWVDRASDSERFGRWEAPRRWTDLFEVSAKQLMTKAERDRAADGPQQLTVPEIKALIHASRTSQRMLMLLALLAGLGQSELAVTRRDEFDLDAGTFSHRRNKTGRQGRYWLPPELVVLLRAYFEKTAPGADGLAFRTRLGLPLVSEKNDSVRLWFERVRDQAKISRDGIGFYSFRRFWGDRAKRSGGTDLRDAALAHAGHAVGDEHYSNYRDWDRVAQLGREMHTEFTAAGVFDWPASELGNRAARSATSGSTYGPA